MCRKIAEICHKGKGGRQWHKQQPLWHERVQNRTNYRIKNKRTNDSFSTFTRALSYVCRSIPIIPKSKIIAKSRNRLRLIVQSTLHRNLSLRNSCAFPWEEVRRIAIFLFFFLSLRIAYKIYVQMKLQRKIREKDHKPVGIERTPVRCVGLPRSYT